jgi:uncharacterized membrane protein (DUF485 family)
VPDLHTEADWKAVERSPEFRELMRRKKAFVVPATIFFLAWYFGFVFLTGYAPDFMGREFITDGLTVGYALALSQFLMTWVLGWMYMRRANRVWDPLAARVRESVEGTTPADARPSTRFRRGELVTEHEEVPQR